MAKNERIVQHDKKQRRFFFLQDTDIVSSKLWTGNFANFRLLPAGRNNKRPRRESLTANNSKLDITLVLILDPNP